MYTSIVIPVLSYILYYNANEVQRLPPAQQSACMHTVHIREQLVSTKQPAPRASASGRGSSLKRPRRLFGISIPVFAVGGGFA